DVAAAFELDEPAMPPREIVSGLFHGGAAAGPALQAPPERAGAAQGGGRPAAFRDEPTPAPLPDSPVTPEPFGHSRGGPPPPAEDLAPKRTTTGRTTRPFAREPHTQLWQKLLRAARDARASDLHIVAARPPLHRVAGQIVAQGDALDPLVVEDMVLSRVPSRLAPA